MLNFLFTGFNLIVGVLLDNFVAHESCLSSSTSTHDSCNLNKLSLESDYSILLTLARVKGNVGSLLNVVGNKSVFECKIESIRHFLVLWGYQVE